MSDPRVMRHLLVDQGKIAADWTQPLADTSLIDSHTGRRTGPGTDMPAGHDGVIERRADGSETLVTVDGLHLDLDGQGGIRVNGRSDYCGNFMVIQRQRDQHLAPGARQA
ncbi:hypothetical protein GCM10010411_76980 [Actinomadura fulvescens]|uniref:Uncharacterized protein n=1 Tax=Actinomadura fulvescens TaxID=46160 RepID=A0ABN3QK28_9ACTN